MPGPLVVMENHPVQYHAPVYRAVEANHGIPVTVVYGSGHSISGYRDREFGSTFSWDVDLLSGYRSIFLRPSSPGYRPNPIELIRRVAEVRPAAVLLVGYAGNFDRRAALAMMGTQHKLMLRAETTDHAEERSQPRKVVRDLFLRTFYARMTRLLYIGQRSLEHYHRLGVQSDRLTFSPYCVDDTTFTWSERPEEKNSARQQLGLEDKWVLMYSGKLSPRKGIRVLLEAISRADDLSHRLALLFVGSGELEGEIRAWAQRNPEVEVRLMGFQPQRSLSTFYNSADALVLPSLHSETWGLVVNEALLHGVPCVVSEAVGCAVDLIHDGRTGTITRTGSAEDLLRGIRDVHRISRDSSTWDACRATVGAYSVSRAAEGISTALRQIERQRPPVTESSDP